MRSSGGSRSSRQPSTRQASRPCGVDPEQHRHAGERAVGAANALVRVDVDREEVELRPRAAPPRPRWRGSRSRSRRASGASPRAAPRAVPSAPRARGGSAGRCGGRRSAPPAVRAARRARGRAAREGLGARRRAPRGGAARSGPEPSVRGAATSGARSRASYAGIGALAPENSLPAHDVALGVDEQAAGRAAQPDAARELAAADRGAPGSRGTSAPQGGPRRCRSRRRAISKLLRAALRRDAARGVDAAAPRPPAPAGRRATSSRRPSSSRHGEAPAVEGRSPRRPVAGAPGARGAAAPGPATSDGGEAERGERAVRGAGTARRVGEPARAPVYPLAA